MTVFAVWLGVKFNPPRITAANLDQLGVVSRMPIDVWEVKWSRDGGRVAFLSWEKPVEIREAKTLFRIGALCVGKAPIHVAFSPDKNLFAFCENNSKVEIQRLDTGEFRTIDTGNAQPAMEFSPDGTILGTGGYGTHASLWDVATGRLLRRLDMGPTVGGLRTVFSEDGKTVAVGHRNSNARLFDVDSGKQLCVLSGRMTQQLRFDPSGKRLAVAYVDGDIAVFDVRTGKMLKFATTGASETYRVDWSPDGRLLASAGREGDIIIWNPDDLRVLRQLDAPEWVINVKFSPDGTRLITTGGDQKRGGKREVQIWAVPQPWARWLPWP